MRAEFLRNRQLDYVRAARALGLSNWQIMWRHILPNSLTPVVTFLPFRMSAAILALTSLDFLGLGVPPGTPSLGELLSQGKNNLDAWWISLSTFAVLVVTLLLLIFMGDALRDALDPRTPDPPELDKEAGMQRGPRRWRLRHERVARCSPSGPARQFGDKEVVHGVDFDIGARREAGAGGRIGLGQDRDGAQPAAPGQQRRASAGSAWFEPADGTAPRDLLALTERELRGVRGRDIAMIFQEPMTALNPLFTVGDQIAEVLQLKKALRGAEAWERGRRAAGRHRHRRARAARAQPTRTSSRAASASAP